MRRSRETIGRRSPNVCMTPTELRTVDHVLIGQMEIVDVGCGCVATSLLLALMVRLSPAEREAAKARAKKIFEWERICEEHAAILRADPDRMAEAHEKCSANAPPEGFTPPRDEYDKYMANAEMIINKPCEDFVDHVNVVSACLFLCRLEMGISAETNYNAHLEMMRIRTTLHDNHSYQPSHTVIPQNSHPHLARELGLRTVGQPSPVTPAVLDLEELDYPPTMPARPFQSQTYTLCTRAPVTREEVEAYRRNPERLPSHVFATPASDGEDEEFFRVAAAMITGKDKVFYLVFADESSEAVAYSSEDFFSLLASSEQLIM
ncbi:hypothetical protein DL96DRAFT_1680722 [Flagelloscypha sp. PMI_526]|nr:hypothetical protein DL96DRAFT_1680722 [Flagelloscypha sp. PMI_526]